ncbi:hypothetical protein WJX74_001889 [Apatococcus lobatus]|uniref:ABC transporter domain-containing protein n=2 Tax=Apatococcus TaxID=904362 RepID=A0AAW1REJ5_9CHLO
MDLALQRHRHLLQDFLRSEQPCVEVHRAQRQHAARPARSRQVDCPAEWRHNTLGRSRQQQGEPGGSQPSQSPSAERPQVLEQEAAAQNGVEHPVSEAEQDGYELAHQVARSGNGVEASTSGRSATSGRPAEAEGEVLMELHNVHKSFGSKRILQGATIKIRRGDAVGIIGASGTGKSTTLRLMAGLLAPDKGDVKVFGKARRGLLNDDPEAAAALKVGMVFQNGALFDSLSVGENVGFLLYEHSQLSHERIGELVADALAAVGLSGVEDVLPSALSGGMRKRIALARAIVRDDTIRDAEQIIMYDEPTAGLDPVASTVIEDLIRQMSRGGMQSRSKHNSPEAKKKGMAAYIVVTHQHSTIRRAVDRIVFLHEGRVAWEGPVEEFDTTDEPIVRQFASGSLQGPITYL